MCYIFVYTEIILLYVIFVFFSSSKLIIKEEREREIG